MVRPCRADPHVIRVRPKKSRQGAADARSICTVPTSCAPGVSGISCRPPAYRRRKIHTRPPTDDTSGGDHRRPHQYLSQPHAPLNSDDPLLRVPKSGQRVHAHRGCPRSVGRKRATRGAMPATVSLITHPPKRHNHPAAQHRSTRDREHYGETSLPGVVATDLDTEHGGTDAN